MAFLNLSLLLGGLFAAAPVVLHLMLQQQPKRIAFPAIRFLKERQETNRRELRLRHWLLLLLRCGILVAAAVALARPSVASAAAGAWIQAGLVGLMGVFVAGLAAVARVRKRGRWLVLGLAAVAGALLLTSLGLAGAGWLSGGTVVLGNRQAPVAAVLVLDNSPRMEYRYHNQTRLESARETAQWLLQQFPLDSAVAVLDAKPGPAFFAADATSARSLLERVRMTTVPEDLPAVIGRGLELLRTAAHERHEIYVLTDLSRQAWPPEACEKLRERLAAQPNVLVYLIDVGADEVRNLTVGDLQLASETLTQGGEWTVATELRSNGYSGEGSLELLVETTDPTRPVVVDGRPLLPVAQVRDRRPFSITAGGVVTVEFRVAGWERGVHQGRVRVTTEDGLSLDDLRHFTVEVRDAWPVLLVTGQGVDSSLLAAALAPPGQRETGQARFDCRAVVQGDLANQNLESFALVSLLDPQPLPPAQWEQLAAYVEGGGRLLVCLGHHAQPGAAFQDPSARRLLGGVLSRTWRAPDRDVFLAPSRWDHPVWGVFRERASSVPWADFPVYLHWVLAEMPADAAVIASYSNRQPALWERTVDRGKVVIATTPLHEEARPAGRPAWNELLNGENAWPGLVLINELARYLVSGEDNRLNYRTGEVATLRHDAGREPDRYQLFPPSESPQEIAARDGRLTVAFTEQPGAYRFKGNRGGPLVRGFAVNLTAEATAIERQDGEELRRQLGSDRLRLARSREEIVLEVGVARAGLEFYPVLMMLMVLLLALERWLADRFYPPAAS